MIRSSFPTLKTLRHVLSGILLIQALALALLPRAAMGQADPSKRDTPAPALQPNDGWLNTGGPLSFEKELKGRVVLLQFWTSTDDLSTKTLPALDLLEAKFKDQGFVIVGIHSGKFLPEEQPATVRAALQRLHVTRPVVIDQIMTIWEGAGIRAWPTYVFVDSRGYVAGRIFADFNREEAEVTIANLIQEGKAGGTLVTTPLALRPETPVPTGSLAFPGKVLADDAGKRLFIADSGNNRIIVTSLPGADGAASLTTTIGTGAAGSADGSFDAASFNYPQGMAIDKDTLYVADTLNHMIRRVDLNARTVETLAGNGRFSMDRAGGAKGREQGLDGPWDLALANGKLYVAMAGAHQIWTLDPATGEARAWAGSGRKTLFDAPFAGAALASPSGLAIVGDKVYFADTETSSVRVADSASGAVKTLMGFGLLDFGDDDGDARTAHFQYPLGIVAYKGSLLLADTLNNKIRRIDPVGRTAVTIYGTGSSGRGTKGAAVEFSEPSGVSIAGDRLYIADRNNHRVVSVNLAGKDWAEVAISGLSAPGGAAAPKPH